MVVLEVMAQYLLQIFPNALHPEYPCFHLYKAPNHKYTQSIYYREFENSPGNLAGWLATNNLMIIYLILCHRRNEDGNVQNGMTLSQL
jgi:hypothetical protein